jgi:hypothetical protein
VTIDFQAQFPAEGMRPCLAHGRESAIALLFRHAKGIRQALGRAVPEFALEDLHVSGS